MFFYLYFRLLFVKYLNFFYLNLTNMEINPIIVIVDCLEDLELADA